MKKVKVLGIESSCDETAAAVVEDGARLLSNVVHSQIDIHAQYGGVVPEVAARSHIEMIHPVIDKALVDAGCTWDDIDAIAVTYAPGLIGSLLVGTLAARTLAILHDKPLYAIHHVEAHVYANFIVEEVPPSLPPVEPSTTASARNGSHSLSSWVPAELALAQTSSPLQEPHLFDPLVCADVVESSPGGSSPTSTPARVTRGGAAPMSNLRDIGADRVAGPESSDLRGNSGGIGDDGSGRLSLPSKQPTFPMLALIVSGGHSQLVLFRDHGDYKLLGQTTDDAVGEAFDKVAKIIGLPYPGGPSIARAALDGDPHKYQLPKAKVQGAYDFSFSGLKTAVLRAVQRETGVDYTFPSHQLPGRVSERQRADFAASFQHTAVETLVDKAEKAYHDYAPASVVIAGGVAANQELRRQLSARLPLDIEYAPMQLCTDNAAMIATLGYYHATLGTPVDPYDLEVVPSLSMAKTAWRNVVEETT